MSPIPPTPSNEEAEDIRRRLLAGEMPEVDAGIRKSLIKGIQQIRNMTGLSLLSAKEFCQSRYRELGLAGKLETPQDEIRFWRELCIFLADCTAVTAYQEGAKKSCSKTKRDRYESICRDAANALDAAHFDRHRNHARTKYEVAERLRETADELLTW